MTLYEEAPKDGESLAEAARESTGGPPRRVAANAKDSGHAPAGRRNDPLPRLALVQVPIEELRPPSRRVRRTEKAQVERVRRAIESFGCVRPILITGAGEIIDAHVVLEALRTLGAAEAPCVRVDHLSESEIRQLRLALNKIQERWSWDFDALKLEFEELIELGIDLEITGFEVAEIDNVLSFGDEVPDPQDADQAEPDPDAPVVSRVGDLWLLGDHRLLCGNARNADDLRRLAGDTTATMLFTDPPYNVRINGHVRSGRSGDFREFAEASGELSPEAFTGFLTEFLETAGTALADGALAYVFMDWRHMRELESALRQADLRLVNLCVWVKANGGQGSLYRSRHELVFVAVNGRGRQRNNVQLGRFGRNRTNVWEYAGATGGRASPDDDFSSHPTVKPIQLVADAILDVTALGEVVLDPFLGSGTTLLAAERTRRCCLGMELDPAYVDLAIRRWQAMTGAEAVQAATGATFAERAEAPSEGDPAGNAAPAASAAASSEADEEAQV